MGKKVFVSYKYGDSRVQNLPDQYYTRVRDYVTVFQAHLSAGDQINKGEADGEDLSQFKEETIKSKLRDKIYDSSITVVFISKGMKDHSLREEDQWIPWEVAYSLRESTRNDRTSRTNAVLAVVLPDEAGSYTYYIEEHVCRYCDTRLLKTDFLFKILSNNMFNVKEPTYASCPSHYSASRAYSGYSSYIHTVKWSDFVADIPKWLDVAVTINGQIDNYRISKVM